MTDRQKVSLLGGPCSGVVHLPRTPPRLEIGGVQYSLITDPDTGEGLGAYVYDPRKVASK